jgi:hypothetical protein
MLLRASLEMQRIALVDCECALQHTPFVPAEAGTKCRAKELGPRFRGDERGKTAACVKPLHAFNL